MKILVTGGAGFIGCHIAARYAAAGHDVVVVDNLSTGKMQNVPASCRFVELDINSDEFEALVLSEKFDVVNHHAAHMELRVSVEKPVYDANTNVLGSVRLLQASKNSGVGQVILASSCAVIGSLQVFPATEEHPVNPISPYGCSKLSMELYANYFRQVHGMKISTLRYTNVYGPRQNPHGESGVIAIFLNKFLERKPATVNGLGDQLRDYIHVDDVAAANEKALEKGVSGTFIVSSGKEASVLEIVAYLRASLPFICVVEHGEAKSGDPARVVCSPDKFCETTGWKNLTELSKGIRETSDWFQKNAD